MDIVKLRNLIRKGEYFEEHYNDWSNKIERSQWIFNVSRFIQQLGDSFYHEVNHQLHGLKNMPADFPANRDNFQKLLGFMRSLYNDETDTNLPLANGQQTVFIIHGHDDALIEEVKNCIFELDLTPIVLREQIEAGVTIIEKLESWLGNAKCAVVLYTPCDVGRSVKNGEDKNESRSRQNVVYEHGLFQGALGRKRILLLKKGDTILPGDCSGWIYTSTDTDKWKDELKQYINAIDKSVL